MLIRILQIILPLFAISLAGFVYGRTKRPDMTVVNQINMDVFMPVLIFHVLSGAGFDVSRYWPLALATLVVVLGSGLIALPVAWAFRIRPRTFLPPMMFTNTGNLGLPLALFAFGDDALPAMMIIFVTENTLHFTLGIWMMDPRVQVRRVLTIPFIAATVAGLAWSLTGWHVPLIADRALEMVAQIAIPLMLFSLGVRLSSIGLGDWQVGMLGALVCPAAGVLIALALIHALDLPAMQRSLLLVFGALPPAVLNFIVSEKYRQEPEKVASIVMFSHLAALVTVPLALAWSLTWNA